MRYLLSFLLILSFVATPAPAQAQEATPTPPAAIARQVIKRACASAFDYARIGELQVAVLAEAKRQAVAELAGELITAFTQVENFVVTQDQIRTLSSGFVREGDVRYVNGSSLGEVCVVLQAYTTVEDRARFDPVLLVQKNRRCLQRPELSVNELRELTRETALLEILWDYDRKLEGFAPQALVRLFRQISYSQDGFLQDTDVYCVQAQGYVLPVEVMALLAIPTATPTASPTATRTPTQTPTATPRTTNTPIATATSVEASITTLLAMNVRGGPGISYNIVGSAVANERFRVTGKNPAGDWWQIDFHGQTGWVFVQLVSPENTRNVPVVTDIPPTPRPRNTNTPTATPTRDFPNPP